MAASNIYGITSTFVLEELGFTDANSADPGTSAIDRWIQEFAGRVNTRLRGLGIDPSAIDATTHGDLYLDIRGHVKDRVVARWNSRNRRMPELETQDEETFQIWLRLLREAPSHATGEASHDLGIRTNKTHSSSLVEPRSTWLDKTGGFN